MSIKKLIMAISLVSLMACGESDYLVTISTPYGDMKVVLYDDTPLHKENFIKLAKNGDYDSTIFHRVIENFMIQGGDLSSKPEGGEDANYRIPAEIRPQYFHSKGALAAARTNNPAKESSGSQFYIVHGNIFEAQQMIDLAENQYFLQLQGNFNQLLAKPEYQYLRDTVVALSARNDFPAYEALIKENTDVIIKEFGPINKKTYSQEQLDAYSTIGGAPHLDGEYTVFGKVVEGFDVIDAIAAVQKGVNDKPSERVGMKMTVESVSKKKLSSQYGLLYSK
jgi:peptidyl-prolyl cis-trans isomerase B (cyclophilin B)